MVTTTAIVRPDLGFQPNRNSRAHDLFTSHKQQHAGTVNPKSVESTPAHIAIVGAGPRGTSALERLCASLPELLKQHVKVTVHVIDPSSPGSGRVWRTSQSQELLMNTVTSQVTLFTDESVTCEGPIRQGPTLHAWAKEQFPELGPDDYPCRVQYGHYLEWVFNQTVENAPSNLEVVVHTARAVRLDEELDGRQVVTLSNRRKICGLAAVIMAQGHVPLAPEPAQQKIDVYAAQHGLTYIKPINPADVDLSTIAPNEPVLLRGLGLNFFDYMALFTSGRGGRFTRSSSGLVYHPSGKEPRMFAGSRRGVPYQARGDNAKGSYGRHMPLVLTEDVIAGFQQRIGSKDAPDFLLEIWPLVAKEVETVYYEGILGQEMIQNHNFRARFLATPHGSNEETAILDELAIPKEKRWSWDRIEKPYGERKFTSAGEWRGWMLEYLREDAKQAALGNVEGPLKAALDVMRDLRNELRLIVDHDGLRGRSHRDHLDRWYTPLNAFLSIGPPRRRIEELVALVEAGVIDILGPRLSVQDEQGAWVVSSPEVPDLKVRVTTLIEARLPEPNFRHTGDELLAHLMKTGQGRPHQIDGYETGGLDVTTSPYHLIDAQCRPHPRRFAIGVPTEGVHWVTAAGARPGVNSATLCDTDAVARAALRVVLADSAKTGKGRFN